MKRIVLLLLAVFVVNLTAYARNLTNSEKKLLSYIKDKNLRFELATNVKSGVISFERLREIIGELRSQKRSEKNLYSIMTNKKLGVVIRKTKGAIKTTFRLFAPRATEVNLVVYENEKTEKHENIPLKKDKKDGVWEVTINGNYNGKFYQYSIDGPEGNGERFNPAVLISDPYAKANYHHNGRSIIVDPKFNWGNARNFKTPKRKDLIVYEMHIKSYTQHKSSGVKGAHRGKYLGLLEGANSDKILGHLKDLGVTAVEFLPIHEFDNNYAGVTNYWGYMTSHFWAPEASFASDPRGKQVEEFKKLVKGLQENGIAVILDVVFNHTCEGDHRGMNLNFKGIDNKLYYRLTGNKSQFYWNGSGCGNEFKTDSPMVRKYIVDCLNYWRSEYKVNGFRFDLATLIDKDTMMAINNGLPKDTILIAEPWCADWNRNLWSKSDFRGTKWAKWNDDFKYTVRKFVHGEGDRDKLMTILAGSCNWWASVPQESVNFVECHDNNTFNDYLWGDQQKNKLGALMLMTAQGIPMLHEGQEFGKSKKGNDNSYNQDNEINWIDWRVKDQNRDLYEFYRGLIQIRKKYGNFKRTNPLNHNDVNWYKHPNHKALGFTIYGFSGDPDLMILVNSDPSNWAQFELPEGSKWDVLCNGDKAGLKSLGKAQYNYNVPPTKGIILRKVK